MLFELQLLRTGRQRCTDQLQTGCYTCHLGPWSIRKVKAPTYFSATASSLLASTACRLASSKCWDSEATPGGCCLASELPTGGASTARPCSSPSAADLASRAAQVSASWVSSCAMLATMPSLPCCSASSCASSSSTRHWAAWISCNAYMERSGGCD